MGMPKILFTGGGSAGHVVPNIALIEQLLSEGKTDVCYMGTSGIERDIVAEWNIPYYVIECPKLIRGGGWQNCKRNLSIPLRFFRAYKQAKTGLRLLQPDVVFSKGGYVALPVVYAAKKLKIPCFAHESDLTLGLANKLSSRACKRVFTAFPETAKKCRRGTYSGAPIKRAVLSATRAEARRQLQIGLSQKVVLVFGGGSGSRLVNDALRKHLKTLTEMYLILHICGKGNRVESNMKNYRQIEFTADMGSLYAAADLVVARAGAGTIFEVLSLKKAAVFIPLEGQTRGDQVENARYFAQKGLCRVLRQADVEKLPLAIAQTISDEGLRARLNECDFPPANDLILRALEGAIRK